MKKLMLLLALLSMTAFTACSHTGEEVMEEGDATEAEVMAPEADATVDVMVDEAAADDEAAMEEDTAQ